MGASQTSTTNQTQTQTANPVTANVVGSLLPQALNTAATPYSSALNPQVAAQNNQQLAAIAGLGGLQSGNPANQYINQANQYSQQAADPNSVLAMRSQFYQPMSAEVLNQLKDVFGQQNAQLLGNAASSGAIGGSRYGVAASNLANQQGLAAGQTLAGLQQQALNAAQTEQGQVSQQAFAQGQLGQEALNTQQQGIMAALQGGNLTQQQAQALLNAQQQGAIQQTMWSPQMLSMALNQAGAGALLGGTTTGQGTTSTPVNYANMVGGLASLGAGLFAADGGAITKERQHRAIGGGTGIGNGVSGLAGYSGIQSPLQSYFAQSPQVNIPHVNFPTINLGGGGQNSAQQQPFSDPKQMQALGQNLGTMGNAADTYFNADFGGGGADFARGGRVHRQAGGPVASAFPQSIADAIQKHPDATSIKQNPDGGHNVLLQNGIGIKYPGQKQASNTAAIKHRDMGGPLSLSPDDKAQLDYLRGGAPSWLGGNTNDTPPPSAQPIGPSNLERFLNERRSAALHASPQDYGSQPQTAPSIASPPLLQKASLASSPAAPTMGQLTPDPFAYHGLNPDGSIVGAPKPIQDRLQSPVQQASIASPAQSPAPLAPSAIKQPDWGDVPHTPQLASDRQRFAEELRQNPALRDKYLTISLQEQNDPTGNLAIFETAMNRASVNHTSLADELRMHNTEGGYYGGPYRPELLNNPRYRQMAEMNLERALSGSNVAKYGTDNSSGDFGRIRNSNGMYTPTAAYNGEYISYPSRADARGYNGFPEWLNNVGGSIEGGLNQFAGSVKGGLQQAGEGIRGVFGGGNQQPASRSVLDRPDLQPPQDTELKKQLRSFGLDTDQPQGLGGSLGRALGMNPSLSQQNSNRLVNLGLGMMAAGPTVGVKGFPGAAISGLTAFGKGGQYALNQEQQERAQAINLANAAMNQRLHEAQIRHYNMESQKPFVARTTAETVVDPTTGMVIGTKNINHYAQFDQNGQMHWVDEQTNNALNGQPSTGATPSPKAPPALDTIPGEGDDFVRAAKQAGYSPLLVDEAAKVAQYKTDPRQIASRSRHEQLIIDALAHRINKDYDSTKYPAVLASEKTLTSGRVSQGLSSTGRLFDEIEIASDRARKLGNWQSEYANAAAGQVYPSGSQYQAARTGMSTAINNVADAAAAAAKGGAQGAEGDAKRRVKLMNPDMHQNSLLSGLNTEAETALKMGQSNLNPYNAAHGFTPDNPKYKTILDYMTPAQQKKAVKLLGPEMIEDITGKPVPADLLAPTQSKQPATPSAQATPVQQPSAKPVPVSSIEEAMKLPSGTHFTTPDGREKVRP